MSLKKNDLIPYTTLRVKYFFFLNLKNVKMNEDSDILDIFLKMHIEQLL